MHLVEQYVRLRQQADAIAKQLEEVESVLIPTLLATESHTEQVDCWRVTAVPASPPSIVTDWKVVAGILRDLVSQEDWDAAMQLAIKSGKGRKAYLRLTGSLRK